ncbi:MAG: GAF domain-containing protein [Desulfobacterales bacterium]|nr:GAF domain-containing protein [Desulfobacterales bacterium]
MNAQERSKKHFLQPTVNAISTMLELPVSIWLADETAKILKAVAVTDLLENKIGNKEIRLDNSSVATEVFKTLETAIIEDIESDPNLQFKDEILSLGLKSAVMLSLLVKNMKVGVLMVYVPGNKNISLGKIKTKAESSAIQIAATYRHIQGLETINTVGRLINSEINSPELFGRILDAVQDVLKCNDVSIFLAYEEGKLILKESSSREVKIKRKEFRPGEGLAGYVFQTGESLLVLDTSKNPKFIKGISIDTIKERSMLVSPIKTEDKVIGIISASFRGLNGFDGQDQILLDTLTKHISTALQNKELYERENLLRRVSNKVSTTLDLYEVMPLILEGAITLTRAKFGDIHLIDQENISISHSFEYPKGFDHPPPRLSEGKGLTQTIMKTGGSVIIPDIKKDTRVNEKLIEKEIRSLIGVPLKLQKNVLGVLYLNFPHVHHYTEDEKSLLLTLSDQAAISIGNAIQFRKSKKWQHTLNLLHEIVAKINTTSDFKELLKHIVKGAVELVSVEAAGVIHLFDIAGQKIVNSYKFPEDFPHDPRFSEKTGQTWNIFNSGEIDEITDVPYSADVSEEMRKSGVKSIIGVPLKLKDKVIAVLFLKTLKQHKFTQDEKTVLTMLCEHAAFVIEKEKRYDHLNLLREVSNKINATLDLDEVIPSIFEGAIRLTGASFGIVHLINCETMSIDESFEHPPGFEHPTPRLPQKKGLTWEIMNSSDTITISDTNEDSRVNQILLKKRVRSLIGVPLKLQKEVIGVLYLNYPHIHQYTEEEKSLLLTLADQAAISIGNAMQFEKRIERLEKLNRRKKVLIDLGQSLTISIKTENEVLNLIHRNASGLMDTDNMYIALYDKANDLIRFPLMYKNAELIEVPQRKSGKGRTEEIIHTRNPIFIQTRKESEKWYKQPGREEYIGDPLASWIGVPMMLGDKVLGVVAAYHPTKDYVYNKDDLEILQAMANIAAIALDNARTYKQLTQAQDEIANRERELIMSGLAMDFIHKMNNIAGTIPPWVSLIKRKLGSEADPKVTQYLDNIVRDTSYLLKEANELKNPFSKPELIDMEDIIGSVIAQIEMMTPPTTVFDFKADTDLLSVHGIKEHISIAIHSFIMNSVKAISEQGEITIRLENFIKETEKYIQINISDTGCGIPQDKIDSVFEYGVSLWQDKKGTGYGLWRARSIIQSMGGSIKVARSEVCNGTTFTIMLPCCAEQNNTVSENTDAR